MPRRSTGGGKEAIVSKGDFFDFFLLVCAFLIGGSLVVHATPDREPAVRVLTVRSVTVGNDPVVFPSETLTRRAKPID
jgi:hypothetical protein